MPTPKPEMKVKKDADEYSQYIKDLNAYFNSLRRQKNRFHSVI